jgi:hypothetical protein
MQWCLSCHQHPEDFIKNGAKLHPGTNCTTCHR